MAVLRILAVLLDDDGLAVDHLTTWKFRIHGLTDVPHPPPQVAPNYRAKDGDDGKQ